MKLKKLFLSVLPVVAATGVAVATPRVNAAPPSNTNNVTICHRTHATTNPYVRITVDQNSIGSGNSKHGGGAHDLWATTVYTSKPNPNVYNSAKTYPANDKKWGDIIPRTDVSGNALTGNAAQVAGLNYDLNTSSTLGKDIYDGANGQSGKCGVVNARDYYEMEVASGIPPTDVLSDMNELENDEFAAAKTACGGSFTGCNPATLGTTSITISTTVAPTTTVASSTTTVPAAGTSTALGSLKVKIWIDTNRNKKKASSEKYYAGVSVTIVGPGGVTKTGLTDSDGSATFTDLAPGSWNVEATLTKKSLEIVYDSDGTANWKSTSTVVAGQVANEVYAAAPVATASTSTSSLPSTGSQSAPLALVALMTLIAGGAVLASRRRLV